MLSRPPRALPRLKAWFSTGNATQSASATISRTSRLFLDNAYVDAEGGATLPVVSPSDGQAFAKIAHASTGDVDRAVRSAHACFQSSKWSGASPQSRGEVLKRIAATLRNPDKLEELAVIESRDCGKTLQDSKGDMEYCADVLDYFANLASEYLTTSPLQLPGGEGGSSDFAARSQREPLGVVGCITPWNYPLMQAMLKVAPALAAGCTVVLKPSPLASLTCCALGEIGAEAGLPPGALNVVTGGPPEELPGGSSTGQSLIDHPMLNKISFTGSGVAGRKMLEASAKHLRPTALELGGKSAFIIFEDAGDYLDAVVDWVMVGVFGNTGQVCSATSRLLVHRSIEATLVKRLLEAVQRIKVGDPLETDTQMGPLVSKVQKQKVLGMVEQAKREGCTVHAPDLTMPESLREGFFVPPVVLTEVPVSSQAWREEIFGPVLAVRSFETEEEAIAMANETEFGLANAVYSADLDRCARVSSRLQSGIVWENCSQVLFPTTPFGGRPGKASGFGAELGTAGLAEFVAEKIVVSTRSPTFNWGSYSAA